MSPDPFHDLRSELEAAAERERVRAGGEARPATAVPTVERGRRRRAARRAAGARPRTQRVGESRVRRLLPVLGASILAAGGVTAVTVAQNDAGPPPSVRDGHAVASVATSSGRQAATLLAPGSRPVPYARTGLDPALAELLEGSIRVDASRARRIVIPGDARPGWLFAGDSRVALVVPRTETRPDGTTTRDGASVFGEDAIRATTTGFVVSQGGGGQERRRIVVIPPGAAEPVVVDAGTDVPATGVAPDELVRDGQLFVARLQEGHDLLVPSLPESMRRITTRGS